MAKNKSKLRKSEVAKHGNAYTYKLIKDRTASSSIRLEVITAILLGVTMLLSAWAAWISSWFNSLVFIGLIENTKPNRQMAR